MRYYYRHNLINCYSKEYEPNPTSLLGGMVQNRDEHREPVIRAFVALPVETLAEVTERCLPGSGLCVSAAFLSLNRDEQIWTTNSLLTGTILEY